MDLAKRRWYAVAALIAVLGWVVGTAHAASAWDPLRDTTVTPLGQNIDPGGDDVAVFTDLQQPERNIRCFARADGPQLRVPAAPVDITVDSDGSRWHLIGVLRGGPDGLHVACGPADAADGATDTARYATAVVDLSSRVGAGRVIGWGGFAAGALLAGATVVARTRRLVAHD